MFDKLPIGRLIEKDPGVISPEFFPYKKVGGNFLMH
jgi:hypothetical protein